MTSPSHTHWRMAFEYRSKAYKHRSRAAARGAKVMKYSRVLPGSLLAKVRALLSNLEDPNAYETAYALLQEIKEERRKAHLKSSQTLGKNPSKKAVNLAHRELWRWASIMFDMHKLVGRLGMAQEFENAELMMTELGDALAATGQ